jgi:hypothetical protein
MGSTGLWFPITRTGDDDVRDLFYALKDQLVDWV